MRHFDHFDILAPFYDQAFNHTEDPPIQEIINLPIKGRLLDAGGGTGRISQVLAEHASQAFIMDTSIPMLRKAVSKGCCHTVAGSTELPPFKEASFQRIIMVDAFHHLEDQEASLGRLWNLLEPGGRVVIEEPDIHHWGVKAVALAEKLLLMRSNFWAPSEIAQGLKNLGASVELKQKGYTSWVIAEKQSEVGSRKPSST